MCILGKLSVSVGNTAQRSQIGARRVGLGVHMKCFLSLVLNDWAQLLWSWVNPWFWWLSEVVYSSLLQSLVDMNVYRRPSCRQWFGMSQDDCAVIDAGRVEVVGPPAGQGGLVLLCARLSVYWRYDDFEAQQYSTNENPSLSRNKFLPNLMHGHSDSSSSGSSLPEITEQRIFHVLFYCEQIKLKCIINCIYPSWLNF